MRKLTKIKNIKTRVSQPVRLTDDGNLMMYELKKIFGFIPEVVVVEKIKGEDNAYCLHAVMPAKEQLKKG